MKTEEKRSTDYKEDGLGNFWKVALLWEILFELDFRDAKQLEEKVYQYGSYLKESDYLGRRIFLRLMELLQVLKE